MRSVRQSAPSTRSVRRSMSLASLFAPGRIYLGVNQCWSTAEHFFTQCRLSCVHRLIPWDAVRQPACDEATTLWAIAGLRLSASALAQQHRAALVLPSIPPCASASICAVDRTCCCPRKMQALRRGRASYLVLATVPVALAQHEPWPRKTCAIALCAFMRVLTRQYRMQCRLQHSR